MEFATFNFPPFCLFSTCFLSLSNVNNRSALSDYRDLKFVEHLGAVAQIAALTEKENLDNISWQCFCAFNILKLWRFRRVWAGLPWLLPGTRGCLQLLCWQEHLVSVVSDVKVAIKQLYWDNTVRPQADLTEMM